MRVISGIARGHTLKAPSGQLTRPTLDRVREAIFNVISAKVPGSTVLDLFAGSGAMGIEALSRGAAGGILNDYNKKTYQIIKDNLIHTKLTEKAEVYNVEALHLLDILGNKAQDSFDLVFLDPPYNSELYEKSFNKLIENRLLNEEAIIVAETSNKLELKPDYDMIRLQKFSSYGDTSIWYYKYMEV